MKANELSIVDALNYVFKGSPVISIRFDKRKSIVRQILSMYTVEELNEIERKKMNRINNCVKSYAPIIRYRELIENQRKAPSNYKKVLISGNTSIYLASPIYGLLDYNRSLFFENNPANLKKTELINQLIIKQ